MTSKLSDFAIGFLLVISIMLGFSSTNLQAEEMKWRITTYVTKLDLAPVGDVEGHVKGPYTRRGLVILDSGEIGLYLNTGVIEQTKGKGSFEGDMSITFEDGSSFAGAIRGTLEPGSGGKPLGLYKATGAFVSGTGRFQGITGSITSTGKLLTPFGQETKGDSYFDVVANYKLPGK
jgi:hypothetical protein